MPPAEGMEKIARNGTRTRAGTRTNGMTTKCGRVTQFTSRVIVKPASFHMGSLVLFGIFGLSAILVRNDS